MSLFIAGLSFQNPILIEYAKLGILVASITGGLLGLAILCFSGSRKM